MARAVAMTARKGGKQASAAQLRIASSKTPPAPRGEKPGETGGNGPSGARAVPAITWGRVRLVDIDVPADRLRKVDDAWAEVVGKSMRDDGQQQPVRLILEDTGRYTLQIGAHRYVGAQMAQLDELEAGWVRRDWADASSSRIPEIIENLIRNELDALTRAHFLAEYQDIYEALHPEAQHGGDRKSQDVAAKRKNQVANLATWSFRTEAADRTGLSERAIYRAIAMWKGLSDRSRDRLEGTALARNQAALQAIAVLEPTLQALVIEQLLDHDVASVPDAILLAQGKRPPAATEKLFKSVSSGLTRLNAKSRAVLWETYEDEILAAFRKKGIVR